MSSGESTTATASGNTSHFPGFFLQKIVNLRARLPPIEDQA